MIRLDIPSLEIFVAAVDEKSLSRAAERENVVTSAASKRVAELERQVGTVLLRRHGRGVEPTPAGAVLYQRAKSILKSLKLAEDAVAAFSPQGVPKVRLAANRSTIIEFLPTDIAAFLATQPGTHIDLLEGVSGDIPRLVIEGEADLGIYHATSASPGVASFPYRTDHVTLVVPRGHRLAGRGKVFLEEAIDDEFIGYFPRHSYEAFLDLAQRSLSRPLSVTFQVRDYEARCSMVAEGLGIAMIPERVAQAHISSLGLVRLGLQDDWATRQFFVCVRDESTLPPAAAALLQHLAAAGREPAPRKGNRP
jgi:DNA-binding transcriptional LysR family regulator